MQNMMIKKKINISKYPEIQHGKNVNISCKEIEFAGRCFIGDNVLIEADKISIGCEAIIEANTIIKAIKGTMNEFFIGDCSLISSNCRILVPYFKMLDYSQLHNYCLVSGYKPIQIGHNCWIGQQSILNCTENLAINNNVRIGTHSQLWTHVASGELLEGCTLFGEHPLTLEDNVWLVGGVIVSPGLVLKRNSIVMTGSVVTKSTEAFNTYAGIPAANITHKLRCWKKLRLDQKFDTLKSFINEFLEVFPRYLDHILVWESYNSRDLEKIRRISKKKGFLLFLKKVKNWDDFKKTGITVFDLSSKKYIKQKSEVEIQWMKFSVGYRARFIPRN